MSSFQGCHLEREVPLLRQGVSIAHGGGAVSCLVGPRGGGNASGESEEIQQLCGVHGAQAGVVLADDRIGNVNFELL